MKKYLCLVLFSLCLISVQAQTVIRGKIVDKKGVPVPGAKVSVKGGVESTLSEFDGSYYLIDGDDSKRVAVDYVGYNPRKVKISGNNIDIVMTKSNLWNRVPSKMNWLVSLQSTFPENFEQPSFGLMLGCVRKFGGYIKATGGFLPGQTVETDEVKANLKTPLTTATGGVIIRLGSAMHLTFGGGYAARKAVLTVEHEGIKTPTDLSEYSYSTAAVDMGIMLILGHININAGTIFPLDRALSEGHMRMFQIGNFGIGFNF